MFKNHNFGKMEVICLQISQCVFEKVWNHLALIFNNLQQILFLRFIIIAYARCNILNRLNSSFS